MTWSEPGLYNTSRRHDEPQDDNRIQSQSNVDGEKGNETRDKVNPLRATTASPPWFMKYPLDVAASAEIGHARSRTWKRWVRKRLIVTASLFSCQVSHRHDQTTGTEINTQNA